MRERYQIPIEVYSPEAAELEGFVGEHGPNPFYRSLELRVRCCEIRKVSPLTRALSGFDAWVSGQRRDHLTTRRGIRVVERDRDHGGIVKLNPLASWSEAQVWEYLRAQRRALQRALRPGIHQHRLRALHSAHPARRRSACRPLVVGGRGDEGVRHALPDRLELAAGVRRGEKSEVGSRVETDGKGL